MTESNRHGIPLGRRAFLTLSGLTVAGLFLGGRVPKGITSGLSELTAGRNGSGFEIYTIAGFPTFEEKTYRLRLSGLVERPRDYSYKELLALPATHELDSFHCVTGWVVPNTRWTGVRLWDLIAAAGPKPEAKALRFLCLDGAYSESLTFDQARQSNVLLAYAMDGRALSQQQGLPLRLVVPGMYGYKYAKWVSNVQVVDRVYPGYWEQNGYDVDAYIGRSNGY